MTLPEDPTELARGEIRLITPIQLANQYVAVQPANRKTFFQNVQLSSSVANATVTQLSSTNLPTVLQQEQMLLDQ